MKRIQFVPADDPDRAVSPQEAEEIELREGLVNTILADRAAANAQHLEELRLVCAWCSKVLHIGPPHAKTSHGMCTDCQAVWSSIEAHTGRTP